MRALTRSLVILLVGLAVAGCGPRTGFSERRAFDPDSVPEAFRYSTAALMWPGATRSMQVTPAGDLFNGAWITRLAATVDGEESPAPRVIAFEDRWMPVAHWRREARGVRFDFEAVALPEPRPWFAVVRQPVEDYAAAWVADRSRRASFAAAAAYSQRHLDSLIVRAAHRSEPDLGGRVGLYVSLEVRATNLDSCPHRVGAGARFADTDSTQAFEGFDALGARTRHYGWARAGRADSILGASDAPAYGTQAGRESTLAPRAMETVRFVLPVYPMRTDEVERWAKVPHGARVGEARAVWNAEVSRGMRIELGDPGLEDALRAARVTLLALRERRDGRWLPLGGPFHYRDVWLRDGARALAALALHGYTREAREMAASFEDWQWANGPFVSQAAQLDGTGQALWTFEQTMLRPSPDGDVGRYAAAARRAVEWCERMRAAGAARGGPFATFLPYADPHDNELVRAQLVGTDAWAIRGYLAAERLLRAAGRPDEASRVESERRRYVAEFAAALERTPSADIPPSWQGIGLDWGNLAVGWPCQVLPAQNARLAALARRYWSRAGGPGLGFYGTPELLHGYVGADLGTWALLADRRDDADRVLNALERWRSASGGGAEIFTRDHGDYGVDLPPHATAAAALLTLARNCVVYDDGDTLGLTLGARPTWWKGARLERAPTRWGLVDVEFRRDGNVAAWHWTPVAVWTELALPPGTRLAGPPPAPLVRGSFPDRVLAPPGTGSARVRVTPGGGPGAPVRG